jgi:hypothetical protein
MQVAEEEDQTQVHLEQVAQVAAVQEYQVARQIMEAQILAVAQVETTMAQSTESVDQVLSSCVTKIPKQLQ